MTARLPTRARQAQLVLLVRGAPVALAAPVLAGLPLPRLERILEPRRRRPVVEGDGAALVLARVNRAVSRLVRGGAPFVRPGCLTRGITRYYLLRRYGVDVSLCFGTGVVDGDIRAHCWLVWHDDPVLEAIDPRPVFSEITRIPGLRAHLVP